LSQQKAAAALGITPTYLSRLERGHAPLSRRLARSMAEIYRCPIRSLVRRGR
jgi:transcriptional regulator with XRE-family HTH domain